MNKKEILKQLIDIKELMISDIFYVDVDECYLYDNDEMFTALNKGFECLENIN